MKLPPYALTCLLALPSLSAGAHTSPSDDWSKWGGPQRNGVSPESNWSSEGKEQPLWSREVGIGNSACTVAAGRLYTRGFLLDEGQGEASNLGQDVTYCLDALSGKEIWRHASQATLKGEMHAGGTVTTPVIDGERVHVLGRMGTLWALEAASGKLLWEVDLLPLGIEIGAFGLSSSPVVLGEQVIINIGKSVAFDKASGEQLWSTEDYGYSYGTPVPFQHEGKELLAVFNAAGLAVLAAQDGEQLALHAWTSEYNINSATPLVDKNRIFISTGYNEKGCALLEYGSGGLKLLWESRSMNSLMNGCVPVDGHYYGFDKTILKCLDASGKELWKHRGLGRGTLIAAGGRLIVISEHGKLLIAAASPAGFNPGDPRTVFAEGPCWITPTLSDGLIFCRNAQGQLVALDHRTQG